MFRNDAKTHKAKETMRYLYFNVKSSSLKLNEPGESSKRLMDVVLTKQL